MEPSFIDVNRNSEFTIVLLVYMVVCAEALSQYYDIRLLDIRSKNTWLIVCTSRKEILALVEVFSYPPCYLLLADE